MLPIGWAISVIFSVVTDDDYQPEDPPTPEAWLNVAERYLENASVCLTHDASPDMAYFCGGMAMEALLKAVIMKKENISSWPTIKEDRDLYTHDLEHLLFRSSFYAELQRSSDHFTSWQVVKGWTQQPRYSEKEMPNQVAWDMLKAVRHPDVGVYPWILTRYHQI